MLQPIAITAAKVGCPPDVRSVQSDGAMDCHTCDSAICRALYFRCFGIVYLLAFLSLWTQVDGLVGSQGLLPVSRYLQLAHEQLGRAAMWQLPTLLWCGTSDLMIHVWCGAGCALSVGLTLGLAPRLILSGLWLIYLSLVIAGQTFLSFQWDSLLLEMTLCSFLYAPRGLRPDWMVALPPLPAARWLIWGLAFKLMFLSGVTKLLSGDSSWGDGTALQFHYYTQPLPNWPSWYASQCPLIIHRMSLGVMFLIEVWLPFLIFAGPRGRALFAFSTMTLMGLIELTGNFGFFNIQTVVLCLPLLNDAVFPRWVVRRLAVVASKKSSEIHSLRSAWCGNGVSVLILMLSTLTMVREMVRTQRADARPSFVAATLQLADRGLLSWSEPVMLKSIAPFRSINGYGLFRVMTTRRPEIVIEISDDGQTWAECDLKYKPGRIDRAPAIVAPYMPRLDWQMWFAALNPPGNSGWLSVLAQQILKGNPAIARLMGRPDLVASPPKFVRLAYYEYKFSTPDQKQLSGAWWARSYQGNLTGPLSRQD